VARGLLRSPIMKNSFRDGKLQQDVLHELEWDNRVDCTQVGVTVHDAIVTLHGTVDSWAAKLAAADAAHRVDGVLDVANELSVAPKSNHVRNDAEIAAAVRHALAWDVFVPEDNIRTTVTHGIVLLEGEVDYASQREDAARAVGNLAGVCGIDNQLKVTRVSVAADDLRSAIRAALGRHAMREADKLEIAIDRGRVTLSGRVDSWDDRKAIVGVVRGTRGVESVVDHLTLGV
jgi:hyperosmotically inducible protein